jgi:hypothetical protein
MPLETRIHSGKLVTMINPEQISNAVERMVSGRDITYMEAVLELCEEEGLDVSLVSRHLSKPIIENIEREAMEVNLLPRKESLPLS